MSNLSHNRSGYLWNAESQIDFLLGFLFDLFILSDYMMLPLRPLAS